MLIKVTGGEGVNVGVQCGCGMIMNKVNCGSEYVSHWCLVYWGCVSSGSPGNDKGTDILLSCRGLGTTYN